MYYLSDITDGKVGTIINLPSEDYIGYLGWDRADKEREGVFVDTLPECNPPNLHKADLYVENGEVVYRYSVCPILTAAAEEKAKTQEQKTEIERLKSRTFELEDMLMFISISMF